MKKGKKRAWLGRLVIVEMIVCYMAVLTLVSHARGPVKYRTATEKPLLELAGFTSFAGDPVEGDALLFESGNKEGVIGYHAQLRLSGLSGVHVSFFVDCPAEYAGNVLHIDLQESSVGYDNDEQEFFLMLEEGMRQVTFTLTPGESPPDNVLLRFFTLDPAGYIVRDLQVCPEIILPKVTAGMLFVTVLCFALLLITGVYWGSLLKKEGDHTIKKTMKNLDCMRPEATGQGCRKEARPVLSIQNSAETGIEQPEREMPSILPMEEESISPQLSMPEWKVQGMRGWVINPLLQRVACLLEPLLEQQSAKNSHYLERFRLVLEERRILEGQLGRALQLLDAQRIFLEQLKEKLDTVCGQGQYYSETLADQSFHLAQAEEKLNTLQNQSQFCVETLSDHSFRLTQAEKKLESVQNQGTYNSEILGDHSFCLTQTAEKLETLQNQSVYNSETLSRHSFRLVQAEKNLDTVRNQSQFNSEVLADQNFRLEIVERKSEKLQYRAFSNPNAESGAGYYSQSGEDMIIEYILERLQISPAKISYLDLGANHAVYLSNTNYFYQRGARGVLVEANPNLIPELEMHRKGDTILHRCISALSGTVEKFYILNNDGLSSPDYQAVEECMRRDPGVKIEKVIDVETISVNDILNHYFHETPTIVNVDIEGKELEILNGLDFKTHRPLIFIIETIPYRTKLQTGEKQTAILDFMKTAGYVEYAFTGINSIFVDVRAFQAD